MEQRTKDLKMLAEAGVFSEWPTPADLADAASELEEERGERALAWAAQQHTVKELQAKVHSRLTEFEARPTEASAWAVAYATRSLLLALDELERLEGAQ